MGKMWRDADGSMRPRTAITRANDVLRVAGFRWCRDCAPIDENIAALTAIADGDNSWRDGSVEAIKPLDMFSVALRAKDGSVVQYSPICKPCKSIVARGVRDRQNATMTVEERRRKWRLARRRTKLLAAQRGELEDLLSRYSAATTRWYEALKTDPARYAQHLKTHAETYRARRLAAGHGVREVRELPRAVVPLEPFARWLDVVLAGLVENDIEREESPVAMFAAALEVAPRSLLRYRSRDQPFVDVDVVDRALLFWGRSVEVVLNGTAARTRVVSIDDLYPPVDGVDVLNVSAGKAQKVFERVMPHALVNSQREG